MLLPGGLKGSDPDTLRVSPPHAGGTCSAKYKETSSQSVLFKMKPYSQESLVTGGDDHFLITLKPRSNQPEFEALHFDPNQAGDLQVIGEFVTLID